MNRQPAFQTKDTFPFSFGGGFFGTWLFGIVLGWFGGLMMLEAWVLAFASSGFACLVGVAAMILLREHR